ncbi:DUF4350 domain-containing protein [Streptomyces sp. T7(2022)]|uniref:DUF4350 domain-containing protein n=1 Tax=Streptomyces sp. T7(2022) TaxID=2916034 RepID=UPI001EE4A4AE|nr:DUF4350 domain-containing protein [Streptomyces sp. T7(2022)]MCG5121748.1 DUF4350 domain-containing protein [Streptomyces sp. T7(2022)]
MTSPSPASSRVPPLWARSRGVLLAVLLIIVAGIILAALQQGDESGELDPSSYDPRGSRALAALLAHDGIRVQPVDSLTALRERAGPDTTLLVTVPDRLTGEQQAALRSTAAEADARLVLVAPGSPSLAGLAPGTEARPPAERSTIAPTCTFPAAQRAGDADVGGLRYFTDVPGAERCHLGGGLPSLLRLPASAPATEGTPGSPGTVLLGSSDILRNDRLDEHGNASLALQLLGSRPHLLWYLPSSPDASAASEEPRGFLELVPAGWRWATLQLCFAAVLAAIWRGRRLGPVVSEDLPVVVRASETTEGRARLYHRADARDQAAALLRRATRVRLAELTGVTAADADAPEVLLPALTALLESRAPDRDPASLLFGPAPTDDAGLVRLADQLDALEREVRTS